jgi:hypothetical protein
MKRRIVHILRLLIAKAIVATLAILIIRGRDPAFLSFHERSPAEIALSRVIKRVNFQHMPIRQAIDTLGKAANIKIEADDADGWTSLYDHNASLSAEQITLGDALRELLVSASNDHLYCFAEGDRIRIGIGGSGTGPKYVDEYVLPGAIAGPIVMPHEGLFSFGLQPSTVPRLYNDDRIEALNMLPPRAGGARMSDQVGVVWPPHLFVLLPASSHQEVREIFAALPPGATAAARRKLPFGTDFLDFVDGRFRSRDNRAANDALRSVLPAVDIPPQSLQSALESLGAQARVRISLTEDFAYVVFPHVALKATQVTLGSALASLLRQAPETGFQPDRDTVWVRPEPNSRKFRAYDLQPCFADCSQDQCMNRLRSIRDRAGSQAGVSDGSSEGEGYLGSFLVVRGTWDELELQEKSLLECLKSFDSNHTTTHP